MSDMDQYDYSQMDLESLATEFKRLQLKLKEAGDVKTGIQKQFDYLRKAALPAKMEEMGIESAKIKGVGRIGIRPELYASILADNREAAYEWLREHGHGDIINPTVNSSTFKAFCKEAMKQGEELPDELFKITPYDMATLTKE